jgi:hypothetical protein
MVWLYASLAPSEEKCLKAFVAKRFNHDLKCKPLINTCQQERRILAGGLGVNKPSINIVSSGLLAYKSYSGFPITAIAHRLFMAGSANLIIAESSGCYAINFGLTQPAA